MKVQVGNARPGMIGSGGGMGCWRDQSVEQVSEYCPLLALAKAWKRPMNPVVYNIIGSFTSAVPTTTQSVSWQVNGAQTRLSQFAVVDAVMFEIDVPSANAGSVWKPISDFFFGLQSGITAQMLVVGAPQYPVAPDLSTPIRTLCAMLNENWPQGWVLLPSQSIMMQFSTSFALPFLPATVTVSFRMWQPDASPAYCGLDFVGMSNSTAREELCKLGYNVLPKGDAASMPVVG